MTHRRDQGHGDPEQAKTGLINQLSVRRHETACPLVSLALFDIAAVRSVHDKA